MNWLMRLLLGATAGAQTSEARMAIGGALAGAGMIYMGDTVNGVHLLMTAVGGYLGSRGLAKAGEAVAAAVRERRVAAEVAARASQTPPAPQPEVAP